MPCWWVLTRTKQLSTAATARIIWLCACAEMCHVTHCFHMVYLFIFFLQFSNSVSVSGGYGGVTGSLTVNTDTFKESMSNSTKFGSNKTVFKSGGPDLPEPIKVKLTPIYKAFKMGLFDQHIKGNLSRCPFSDSFFSKLKTNTIELLKKYPSLKGTVAPRGKLVTVTNHVFNVCYLFIYCGSKMLFISIYFHTRIKTTLTSKTEKI